MCSDSVPCASDDDRRRAVLWLASLVLRTHTHTLTAAEVTDYERRVTMTNGGWCDGDVDQVTANKARLVRTSTGVCAAWACSSERYG